MNAVKTARGLWPKSRMVVGEREATKRRHLGWEIWIN